MQKNQSFPCFIVTLPSIQTTSIRTRSYFSFHAIVSAHFLFVFCNVIAGAKFKVAVLGGGPSGACAAEALARDPNIECILFERKMDNAKPW